MTMWKETTASGKTRFVERYDNPLGGKPIKVSQTVDRVTKAIEREMPFILQEKFEAKLEELKKDQIKDYTFKAIGAQWLVFYRENVKESTYYNKKMIINKLNITFGDKLLEDITHEEINKYMLNRMQKEKIAYRTVKTIVNTIAMVVKYAYKYEGINKLDMLNGIEIPKLNLPENNDLKYLTDQELDIVINHLESIKQFEMARMVKVQVSTGMRYHEMTALRETDIDFDNNSMNVSRNYDHINNLFTTTKTGEERTVYFNQALVPVLKEQIAIARMRRIKHNLNREEPLLFVRKTGKPISLMLFSKYLKQIELPEKKVTSHIFRHTFITKAVESGISKDIIAKQVGHVNTNMIDRVYAHFTDKMAEKQKEAILDFKII